MYILFDSQDNQRSGYYQDDILAELKRLNLSYAKEVTERIEDNFTFKKTKIINPDYDSIPLLSEELETKVKSYILDNIGDHEHQLKYLGRFSKLQDKLIDGIELTPEEGAEKIALKALHARYENILIEYNILKSKIELGETPEIIFNS